MTGRWDYLVDRKPQPLKDYVLDQVADRLARHLEAWPPGIDEWLDESHGQCVLRERAAGECVAGALKHRKDAWPRVASAVKVRDICSLYNERDNCCDRLMRPAFFTGGSANMFDGCSRTYSSSRNSIEGASIFSSLPLAIKYHCRRTRE